MLRMSEGSVTHLGGPPEREKKRNQGGGDNGQPTPSDETETVLKEEK